MRRESVRARTDTGGKSDTGNRGKREGENERANKGEMTSAHRMSDSSWRAVAVTIFFAPTLPSRRIASHPSWSSTIDSSLKRG